MRRPNAPGLGPPNFTPRGADQLYAPPARPTDEYARLREWDQRQRALRDPRAGPGGITVPVASPYGFGSRQAGMSLGRAGLSEGRGNMGLGTEGGDNARWMQVNEMQVFRPTVVNDAPHGEDDDSSSRF